MWIMGACIKSPLLYSLGLPYPEAGHVDRGNLCLCFNKACSCTFWSCGRAQPTSGNTGNRLRLTNYIQTLDAMKILLAEECKCLPPREGSEAHSLRSYDVIPLFGSQTHWSFICQSVKSPNMLRRILWDTIVAEVFVTAIWPRLQTSLSS